ncbi:MAG TPA: hypothetical protein VHZ50_12290 [Puia sp.]|nr:hypothetical protein [Puia sp.]
MKQLSIILATGIILFFASCSGSGSEEKKAADTTATTTPPPPPPFKPFDVALITHKVKNFDKWKAAYLSHDSVRKAYGLTDAGLGRGLQDSNMVTVTELVSDVKKAKEFSMLPDLKEAMKKGGVVGAPTFDFIHVIRFDTSKGSSNNRLEIAHKVKDFDAWLKVFDNEGSAARAGYGMVDKGLARGIDDSTMVYILFVVTDTAKAMARGNSPELKKIMTDAGVVGAPRIKMFKEVE